MQPSDAGGSRTSVSATTMRPGDARPAPASIGRARLTRQPSVIRRRSWPLTSRETEVLAEMASGKTNAAIAQVLFISRKSVEKHVNSIFSKLLVAGRDEHHPRVQAVLTYLAHTQSSEATTWGALPLGVAPAHTGMSSRHRRSWTHTGPRRRCGLAGPG
jgi:DNA-binding CsgD family transcriptional regulator